MGKLGLFTVVLAAALTVACAQTDKVARGKYLADNVGLCGDCHSGRLPNGELDHAQWLTGGAPPFKPTIDMPDWAGLAPDLTPNGTVWKSWGEEGLVKFLQTGIKPSGERPKPPMPPYRLSREDAEALVAYLKTLK